MKHLNQQGSITLAIAGLLFAILSLFGTGLAAVGILNQKHKLHSATDLAALSAAMALPDLTAACLRGGAELAQAGFQLQSCQGSDHWVSLQAKVEISVLRQLIQLNSEATAGW